MAYDDVPGSDPRGPWCPGCKRPVRKDEPATFMHFKGDPTGALGMSGRWHSECARPYWDTMTPVLKRLRGC
jgi:hypothetical protein